ncbi:MAG: 4-hydroxy-tetrahydrodipicolinate synthase [Elusimicrobia bacterium]|nr:4-hydroxy-tetrahydrodipicolinate synthase [Elusimicrobiota bacterium]
MFPLFTGSFVALVTPFKKGKLDEPALRRLVSLHLKSGTHGLVPCGSTGEGATLTPEEFLQVIRIVVEEATGKIPVVAGIGTNATWKSIEMAEKVAALKVDGLLSIVPYYNKPTQEGIFQHFKALAGSTKLPIIIYNIPGRTGVNMLPPTLARLAKECKNIVGVKEASGNLDQVSEILGLVSEDFSLLSGDDSLTLPMLSVGARGVISVVANICPKEVAEMVTSFLQGDKNHALQIHQKLFGLTKTLFVETNPIPLKTAMGMLNHCSSELRLPLTPLSDNNRKVLELALRRYGLL